MVKLRCKVCILPDTAPGIEFDNHGTCKYCNSHNKLEYKGESKLIKLLRNQKKGNYDCIVPISGGRDSTYVLLKMVKDYQLNVLAVTYENPFTDPLAYKNVNSAISILGVDLIKIQDKNRIHERIFLQNVKTFLKNPDPAMFPILCTGCRAVIPYEIHKIAKKNNIHFIINGANPFEETAFKTELLNLGSDKELGRKEFTKSVLFLLKRSSENLGYFKPLCIPVMIKDYLFSSHFTRNKEMSLFNTIDINLFSYLEWDELEIISRIKSELNWENNPEIASTWRFDCKVGLLKDFVYMNSLGITEKDDFYAKMIRENKITRSEAIERLKHENKIYYKEILSLLNPLGYEYKDLENLKDKLQRRAKMKRTADYYDYIPTPRKDPEKL